MKKLTNPWLDLPGYFCFGCAPENKAGVKMNFYSDGDDKNLYIDVRHPFIFSDKAIPLHGTGFDPIYGTLLLRVLSFSYGMMVRDRR